MFLKNLKLFIKIFFFSKWVFTAPPKKFFLIIDGENNPFDNYLKKKNYNIFFRRGEEINLIVLFKCIFNLKFSIIDYYEQYINYVRPKVILTAFDHYPSFFRLSKKFKIKTIIVTVGSRTPADGLFATKFGKTKHKDNYVDHIFTFNETMARLYRRMTNGNVYATGSFINNIKRKRVKKKKKEILFISTFKPPFKIWPNNRGKKLLTHADFQKNDKYLIKNLSIYAKKNKLKLNVLGRQRGSYIASEKKYFSDIIIDNFNYFSKDHYKDSYYIMSQFKYVFTTWSTLGLENLVKDGRTGFIYNKPKNIAWDDARLGCYENLKLKGPFWTTTKAEDVKEFYRIFDVVTRKDEKYWKFLRNKYKKKLLAYDENNQTFLNIINNIQNKEK